MSEGDSVEITYGRIDGWIGEKIMFPIVRNASRPFGSFLLVRMLLGVAVIGNVLGLAFLGTELGWVIFTSVFDVAYVAWLMRTYVRPMERLSEHLDRSTIPIDLVYKVQGLALLRLLYLGMALLFSPGATATLPIIGFWILISTAFYATTCIRPRRKSKVAAKIRSALQNRRQVLIPALVSA